MQSNVHPLNLAGATPPRRPPEWAFCTKPFPHRLLFLKQQRLRLRFERLHTLLVNGEHTDYRLEQEAEAIAALLGEIDQVFYRLEARHE